MKPITFRCLKCGYKWHPRKAVVRACPSCKQYHWNVTTRLVREAVGKVIAR